MCVALLKFPAGTSYIFHGAVTTLYQIDYIRSITIKFVGQFYRELVIVIDGISTVNVLAGLTKDFITT